MLPSLEPEGQIPKTAIGGRFVEQGHIAMVTKWSGKKGKHPEPIVISKRWVETAKEKWGERCGLNASGLGNHH
eukprot:11899004-Karenia_brevis.AAC.1